MNKRAASKVKKQSRIAGKENSHKNIGTPASKSKSVKGKSNDISEVNFQRNKAKTVPKSKTSSDKLINIRPSEADSGSVSETVDYSQEEEDVVYESDQDSSSKTAAGDFRVSRKLCDKALHKRKDNEAED